MTKQSTHDTPPITMMAALGVTEDSDATKLLRRMYRMESSGASSDCLIHTFLTATCKTFRELDKAGKNSIASILRRKSLIRLLNNPTIRSELEGGFAQGQKGLKLSDAIDTLDTSKFLLDHHVNLLTNIFKVNVLMLETPKTEQQGRERVTQKSSAFLIIGNSSSNIFYLLSNRGNNHYEAVAVLDSGKDPVYTITREEADGIMSAINKKYSPVQITGFKDGAQVKYNDTEWTVTDRIYGNSGNLISYKLNNKSTGETATAPLDQVSAAPTAGGGSRKARRRAGRKTRRRGRQARR